MKNSFCILHLHFVDHVTADPAISLAIDHHMIENVMVDAKGKQVCQNSKEM